jgi:hypothetical protein
VVEKIFSEGFRKASLQQLFQFLPGNYFMIWATPLGRISCLLFNFYREDAPPEQDRNIRVTFRQDVHRNGLKKYHPDGALKNQ